MEPYRLLSSKTTFSVKFLLPAAWTLGYGTLTLLMWLDRLKDKSGNAIPMHTKWTFLAILIFGSYIVWWLCLRLMKVSLAKTALLISNYSREIVVPLSNMAKVTTHRFQSGKPITIHFKQPTEFGSSVTFLPPAAIGWNSSASLVRELQELEEANSLFRQS